jgi:hypothetical protein
MERLDGWLRARPLAISLLLGLGGVAGLCAAGVLSEDVMPFGDGEHYLMRAFTLYGYLHTGEWAKFWDLFTLPRQSIAPLHYWIFFLLPQALAGITAYGIIQAATTYALLAVGSCGLCRALDRPAWAPALFLLCAAQNISLDFSYFYFVDLPFYAFGTVALAWQMRAWRELTWRSAVLSGLGAGLLFWVKPANAVIFTATWLLAEGIRIALLARYGKPGWWKHLGRHAAGLAAGYLPITLLALACGGIQSILRLIDANEASGVFVTHLDCTGLTRLLYFPLCLTFYYHTGIVLLIVAAAAGLTAHLDHDKTARASEPDFRPLLLLPLLAAYLIFGEFFSFGMANKEMRSLLLILPIFWLAIFWMTERWRFRPGTLFLAAAVYTACGYLQIFTDAFGSTATSTQSFQLKDDWLERLPRLQLVNRAAPELTRNILGTIRAAMPDGGRVAIGTEQIYFTSESLTWTLQHDPALHGRQAPYEFRNFLTHDGKFYHDALRGSRGIFVCIHPDFQYSEQVRLASTSILQFAVRDWVGSYAQLVPLRLNVTGAIYAGLVVTREPLDDTHVTAFVNGTMAEELPAKNEFNLFNDRRLSWADCAEILRRWKEKRVGK